MKNGLLCACARGVIWLSRLAGGGSGNGLGDRLMSTSPGMAFTPTGRRLSWRRRERVHSEVEQEKVKSKKEKQGGTKTTFYCGFSCIVAVNCIVYVVDVVAFVLFLIISWVFFFVKSLLFVFFMIISRPLQSNFLSALFQYSIKHINYVASGHLEACLILSPTCILVAEIQTHIHTDLELHLNAEGHNWCLASGLIIIILNC